MIRRLAIVGLGLLGGSVAKAARAESMAREIVGIGRNPASLKPALVEGAVEYAKSLGLSPHADYARARHIFGDIDPAASDREFVAGLQR